MRNIPIEAPLFGLTAEKAGESGHASRERFEDLGVLFASAARQAPGEPIVRCTAMLDHYVAGLGPLADDVDPKAIWQTAVVTAALRESIFAAFHISRAIDGSAPDGTMLAAIARDATVVEALAQQALELESSKT